MGVKLAVHFQRPIQLKLDQSTQKRLVRGYFAQRWVAGGVRGGRDSCWIHTPKHIAENEPLSTTESTAGTISPSDSETL